MSQRADAFAARSIKRATSSGLETYTAWLAGTSTVSLPACLAKIGIGVQASVVPLTIMGKRITHEASPAAT
jgi:hypothetical protein